jgi:hypothetical protein
MYVRALAFRFVCSVWTSGYKTASNELSPWSRGLPDKLTRPQLIKEFPALYGTQKFITALTRAKHQSLS